MTQERIISIDEANELAEIRERAIRQLVMSQPQVLTCKHCGTVMHTLLGTFPHRCAQQYQKYTLADKSRGHKVVKRATVA